MKSLKKANFMEFIFVNLISEKYFAEFIFADVIQPDT